MNGVKSEKVETNTKEESVDDEQLSEPQFNDLLQQLESYSPSVILHFV